MEDFVRLVRKDGGAGTLVAVKYRAGEFVVHEDVLSTCPWLWRVSHQSGVAVAVCESERVAHYIAQCFANIEAPWPKACTPQTVQRYADEIKAVVPPEIVSWFRKLSGSVVFGDIAA